MIRTILAAALVAGASPLIPVAAHAQSAMERAHHPMTHYHRTHRHMRHHCTGRSNGTGYHGCGTATGGPVGGLPSRN